MKWNFDVEHDSFQPLSVIAKRFGVATKTVGFWCENYGFPHCQPGSQRFTTFEAANTWLAERNGRLPNDD
tara:strand:+ start:1897 stop:2106 length:210 start_codon:yes stop_codon:yes gene_type:complete